MLLKHMSDILQDMLPDDSYLKEAFEALDEYQARSGAAPFVYFRYVDQSDPQVQEQMTKYVMDLVKIDAIQEPPDEFWLWDFQNYTTSASSEFKDLSFENQLVRFLEEPAYRETYQDHIVHENGKISASRCLIFMDNVDWDIVTEQIDALHDQRDVTKAQPINKGRSHWAFFTYFGGYDIWELYATSVVEVSRCLLPVECFEANHVNILPNLFYNSSAH